MDVQSFDSMGGHKEMTMWQSPARIKSFFGKELTGRDAWVHVFAKTWEEREIALFIKPDDAPF